MSGDLIYKNFDQASLDLQYNNRQRVPEVENLYKSWLQPSKQVINDFDVQLDLAYGKSEREKLDLILPGNNGPNAINLYFHGGYWMSRTKSDQTFLARPFVESGVAFGLVEYDLIPDVRMADIIDQCRKAVVWIFENAENINVDKDRIFVSGHSAGGHLTSMLMATDWGSYSGGSANLIKGGCAISGIYELTPVQLSYMQKILGFSAHEVTNFSPIRFVEVPSIPFIIAVGQKESEEFCRQSRDFTNEWNARGANCTYLEVSNCNHFNILENLADPKSILVKTITNQIDLI